MPVKRKEKPSQEITIGDVQNASGTINIAGGNISIRTTTTTSGPGLDEFARAFETIYARIETRPDTSPVEKADLKAEVQEVQAAVKNPKVDESFVLRRLRNLGRMAPEILDVVIATLASPAAGLGMIGKKIAEKAKGS